MVTVPESLSRRSLLKGGVAAAGIGAAATVPSTFFAAQAQATSASFRHGIASGDPLPNGVIIWTRIESGGNDVDVRWDLSRDDRFESIAASGTATATASSDHTVKIDVTGLSPATDYWYRFTVQRTDQVSPTGRTRTAPAADADLDRLRFGVVSCSNWEAGFFSAYRHLAARTDLDAIVHLGDYLYEYKRGEFGGRDGVVRQHDPEHEIVSLADYRTRHAQYKTDPDLAALHARLPFICTWDDHETANDAYSDGAENHTPATEGDWHARRAAAMQAYLEWMPVRASGSGRDAKLYRRLRFGTLAELSMLDLRSYRSEQVAPGAGWRSVDAADRSITGAAQLDWLTKGVTTSPTSWRLVGNPVMIAPLVVPPLEPATTAAVTAALGIPQSGVPVNVDQWDGYTADRRRLFGAIDADSVDNVVFLTGDIHSSWAADLPLDAATYPAGKTVGVEFVVPSITSSSPGDFLKAPPRTAAIPAETAITSINRHIRYAELDSHGYGVLDVTPAAAQMDWFYVTEVGDPNAAVRHGASLATQSGISRLQSRSAPVPQ
ncbi:alkaline phosphatase D family protein [Antrihabitans stalagmiti]|uniref:alkaline phosphatase D family protein n=1 Tax=Antrihabitans stalagmiti TaxID=2799499 RepID=UPI00355803C1